MTDFDIGIGYWDGVPQDAVDQFVAAVESPELRIRVERETPRPRAGIEWMAPTAVVVYLAKPYFDSLLSEMGKDHYTILKRALVALGRRLLGRSARDAAVVSSGGERSTGERFSLVFSVVAEVADGRTIKLLLPKPMCESELADAVEAFTAFLFDVERLREVIHEFDRRTPGWNPVLVWFDSSAQEVEVVNPVPNLPGRRA